MKKYVWLDRVLTEVKFSKLFGSEVRIVPGRSFRSSKGHNNVLLFRPLTKHQKKDTTAELR